jgi:HSP20 family protein
MSMTRWDPFRDMLTLREAMNQLLESSYIHPPGAAGAEGQRGGPQNLALDVAERGDSYVVRASLPGIKPEDVEVSVLGDTLTIHAETKGEDERQSGGYLLRERRAGVVQRTVTLPNPIEGDAVEAAFEHGVLTLTLPKSRASMPRRIPVRAIREAGHLPSLEEQTPGLDTRQEEQTARDAQAYFSTQSGQQGAGQPAAQESGGTPESKTSTPQAS